MLPITDNGDITAFDFEIIKSVFRNLHSRGLFDDRAARQQIIDMALALADGKLPSARFVDAVLSSYKAQCLPSPDAA